MQAASSNETSTSPDVTELKMAWQLVQEKKKELKPLLKNLKRCRDALYDHIIENDLDEFEKSGVSAKRVRKMHLSITEKSLREFAEDGVVRLDDFLNQAVEKEKLVLKIK